MRFQAAQVSRIALIVAFGLAACESTDPGEIEELTCSISPGGGLPGSTLILTGIPAAVADTSLSGYVEVNGDAASRRPVLLSRVSGQSTIAVTVPLNPVAPLVAGSVTFFASGSVASASNFDCQPLSIAIQALPLAPGTAQAAYTQVSRALTPLVTASGATVADLIAERTTGPTHLRAIGAALWLLDGPDNPNSLKKFLDGTAAAYGGQVVDLRLIDGIIASSGVLAELTRIGDDLAAIGPPPAAASPAGGAMNAAAAGLPTIQTAAQLDYWMKVQARIVANQEHLDSVLNRLGIAATLAGSMAPILIAPIAAMFGVIAFIEGLVVDAMKQTLPSELSIMTVDVSPTELAEDAAAPGQWSNARLFARSGRWSITLPQLLDGVLLKGGNLVTAGSEHLLSKLYVTMRGQKWALMPGPVKALGEAMSQSIQIIAKAVGALAEGGTWVAGPYTYGPVDVTSPTYSTAFTSSNGVISLTAGTREFRPVAAGTTNLIVRTRPEWFATKVTDVTTAITVRGLAVKVTAANAEVRPGASQLIVVEVTGATDTRVTWSTSGGSIVPDGGAFANWTAPQTVGTYTITACHITKTTRCGSATVVVSNVITVSVSPAFTELPKGGSRTFTATVEGTQNLAVTWTVPLGSGTITSSGVFTAPQTVGTVIVTARSVADATKTGTAQVQITEPAKVRGAATIATGANGTCALDYLGAAWCWGLGSSGQLGSGQTTFVSATPVPVAGGRTYVTLSGNSSDHYCALDSTGAAYCWGSGVVGTLGSGIETNSNVPVAVAGGLSFKSLSVGTSITCGITSQDQPYCWGSAGSGAFGGPAPASCKFGYLCSTPQLASGLAGLNLATFGLAALASLNCGVTTGGQVYCWGTGYLGDGVNHTPDPSGPVRVTGLTEIVSVVASSSGSCALSATGGVSCWGQSTAGEFGNGAERTLALTPVAGGSGMSFTSLSLSWGHACALTTAGRAYCWGQNGAGAVGIPFVVTCQGSGACVLVPTEVSGARTYASVSTGPFHSCGITTAGEAYCWGLPSSLGLPNNGSAYFIPQKVGGGVRFMVTTP